MLSLIILLGLLIAFSNRVIETVSMMSINSTTNSLDADDPVPLTISTFGEPRNFMFGVEIWHHNLNTDERIFDIDLINKNYVYG